jgi:hypothetical protein
VDARRTRRPPRHHVLLALGGAIATIGQDATAFPFRQARWLVNIPATWRDPAREAAGEQAVRHTLRRALQPFQDPRSGAVTLGNTFRWVAAGKP